MAQSSVIGLLRVLLSANTAEFDSAMRQSSKSAEKWTKDLKSMGQQATNVGSTLTKAFTLPIAGVGVAVAKLAMDFESSFAGVRKTVDATEPEFAAMAASFRQLSKEIPVNVNELNRLGEAAGALNIPKAEIADFARVMALLGVTTNVTSDQAAESIAKIQTIYQAAGQDTEAFASTLVDLGNKGASTEQEILALANRIASGGRAIGLSQAEVLAFSSAIANVGIEAEAGGSAITRVFGDISIAVSQGGSAVDQFAKTAGMSVEAFSKLFKEDAATAIDAFLQGIGRLHKGGADLNLVLSELGFTEIRQARAVRDLALSGDNLTKSLQNAKTAWKDQSALSTEAAERFKTTASQLTLLWNRIKDVGITLGNALLPAIQQLIGVVDKLLPVLEMAAKVFTAMPASLQLVALGLAAAAAAAGPLIFAFGQMALGVSSLTALFAKNGIATKLLAGDFTTLGGASTIAATGLGVLRTALTVLLGPIGLVGAAAVGATAAITGLIEARAKGKLDAATIAAQEDSIRIAIERGASAFINYTEAVKFNLEWNKKRLDGLKSVAEETKRTTTATQSLSDKLDAQNNIVKAADKEIAQLSATAKSKLVEAIKSGAFSVKELSEATGLSEIALKRFEDSLKRTGKAAKEMGKDLDQAAREGVENYKKSIEAAAEVEKLLRESTSQEGRGQAADALANRLKPLKESVEDAKEWINLWTKGIGSIAGISSSTMTLIKQLGDEIVPSFTPEKQTKAQKFGEDLAQTVMQAFMGGGDGGKSIGAFLGKSAFDLSGLTKKLSDGLTGMLGKTIGGALGAIIPGIGPLLGSMLGPVLNKIGGWVKGLFGGGEGRDMVKDFGDQFGGLNKLHDKLIEALDPAVAENLWIALTQGVGRNNPQQAQAAIDAITEALARAKKGGEEAAAASASALADALSDIAAKYAETLSQIDSERKTLIDRIAGEAPEEFMGLQEIADRARLAELDAQKAAIEEKQRIEEEAAREAFANSTEMADVTLTKIQEIFDRGVEIPIRFRMPDMPNIPPVDADPVPGFARGSNGWRNFGDGTLAVLHGTEAVVRPGDTLPGLREPAQVPIKPEIHIHNDFSNAYVDERSAEKFAAAAFKQVRRGGALYSEFQNLVSTTGTRARR